MALHIPAENILAVYRQYQAAARCGDEQMRDDYARRYACLWQAADFQQRLRFDRLIHDIARADHVRRAASQAA